MDKQPNSNFQVFVDKAQKIMEEFTEENPEFKKFCEEREKVCQKQIEEYIKQGYSETQALIKVYSNK